MFQVVVMLVLTAIGAGALYAFYRWLTDLDKRAVEGTQEDTADEPELEPEPEITEPLGPESIVYLCAHEFVPPGTSRTATNPRLRACAPLTGEELEPRRVAEQMLYALLVSLIQSERLKLWVAEAEPSFMPPFPHKRWTLRAMRLDRLSGSPLGDVLDCAFDLGEQRVTKKGGSVEDGIPIEELIEDMLRVMRQEMSFWEKAGVYADIRQYVEAALLDANYLIPAPQTTWLDRLRHTRPSVNERAKPYLGEALGKLADQLQAFRQTYGSKAAAEADTVPGGRTEEIDQELIEAVPPFAEMPMHDCLKISIYEALLAIRQLEPSEDVGV